VIVFPKPYVNPRVETRHAASLRREPSYPWIDAVLCISPAAAL